jgi:hypothetical protein
MLTKVIRLLLLFFLSSSVLVYAGPSKKPLSPLRINIAPVQAGITSDQIKPGDIVEFNVTAVSSIDTQELTINVELVGGVQLVSGDTSWNGPAAKNEEKSIALTVRAPRSGKGMIEAHVSIPPSDGARFSAGAQYTLGSEVKTKPENDRPVKKDLKGQDVIEYR